MSKKHKRAVVNNPPAAKGAHFLDDVKDQLAGARSSEVVNNSELESELSAEEKQEVEEQLAGEELERARHDGRAPHRHSTPRAAPTVMVANRVATALGRLPGWRLPKVEPRTPEKPQAARVPPAERSPGWRLPPVEERAPEKAAPRTPPKDRAPGWRRRGNP